MRKMVRIFVLCLALIVAVGQAAPESESAPRCTCGLDAKADDAKADDAKGCGTLKPAVTVTAKKVVGSNAKTGSASGAMA